MGLRILQERIVWWPVTVNLASRTESGKTDEFKGEIHFRVPAGSQPLSTDAIVEIVDDWRGDAFAAEDGSPCPFSKDELRRAVDENPAVGAAVVRALLDAMRGAAAKN